MRHWCATTRLIEWGNDEFALSKVSYWLGHSSSGKGAEQTWDYLHLAHAFDDKNESWLSRALKHGSTGGMHVSPDFTQQLAENSFVEQFYSKKNRRICRDSNPG